MSRYLEGYADCLKAIRDHEQVFEEAFVMLSPEDRRKVAKAERDSSIGELLADVLARLERQRKALGRGGEG